MPVIRQREVTQHGFENESCGLNRVKCAQVLSITCILLNIMVPDQRADERQKGPEADLTMSRRKQPASARRTSGVTGMGMDAAAVRRRFPGLRFIGGFNEPRIRAGRSTIDAALERILPVIRGGGIAGNDHQVPSSAPLSLHRCSLEAPGRATQNPLLTKGCQQGILRIRRPSIRQTGLSAILQSTRWMNQHSAIIMG